MLSFLLPPRKYARLVFTCASIALTIVAILPDTALADLQPDEIVLITNKNVPQSRVIADYYIKARHLPEGRIIELDLPFKEEITYDAYERSVVPQVKAFLRANHLEQKIKCLVTVYGVPIRIAARQPGPTDPAELAFLQTQLTDLEKIATTLVEEGEALATAGDANFKPADNKGWEALRMRAERAGTSLSASLQKISDVQAKADAFNKAVAWRQKFTSSVPGTEPAELSAGLTPEQAAIRQSPLAMVDELRDSAPARARVRELVREQVGLFPYVNLLRNQMGYLTPGNTIAAFDSELSLLWWSYYPRGQWQPNFLNYHFNNSPLAPSVMTMRLDAPEPQMVRDFIAAGIVAESKGLKGRVAIDSRGIPATNPDGYGTYDQTLRNLADLLKKHSKIDVVFDGRPELFKERQVRNVAVYCGWYSVGNYIPGMGLVPGAVGFHVASFEMVSLHDPKNNGWAKGLIKDGMAATLGAVEEPYLSAFPAADEFFPLLLTGQLPLAEVYWKTAPMTSWMINMIGDPLYTPYRLNPQFDVADLPEPLSRAVPQQSGTTRPATRPATQPAPKPPTRPMPIPSSRPSTPVPKL